MISDIELSIPQSLTPDSSNDDTQSEEPSTPVLSKESHEDALSIVDQHNVIEAPSSFIKESPCRWCQRCGALETPRWRTGPGGSLTLCNACGLRWKTQGKPMDGFLSNASLQDIPIRKRRSGAKKQLPSKKQKTSSSSNNNQVLCDNRIPSKRNSKQVEKIIDTSSLSDTPAEEEISALDVPSKSSDPSELSTSSEPNTPSTLTTASEVSTPSDSSSPKTNIEKEKPSLIEQKDKESKINPCESCHTTNTPLWRRGPSGPRTLCNACGLRWAKTGGETNAPTTAVKKSIPTTVKKSTPITVKKPTPVTEKPLTTPNTNALKKKHQHVLLFNRKEFVKQGLYFDATRLSTPSAKFTFELPMHQGEFLISKEKEFELPPYIHQEVELGLIKAISATRVPFFVRIRSNIFVERKPQTGLKDPLICLCKRPPSNQPGCGDDCINRMMFYECDPRNCPCGDQCSNQRFQRKECKKELEVYHTEKRGWGLRTLKDIKKGELVIEYRGEIISQKECEERMCTLYVNDKNFYFLDYHNGEVIDATTKGTEARFINHSCDPNCHIEKWSCRGESNFGVFASKDIKAYSELFYDYNFSTFNGSVESHQQCHCGSENCRGLIGSKRGARVK